MIAVLVNRAYLVGIKAMSVPGLIVDREVCKIVFRHKIPFPSVFGARDSREGARLLRQPLYCTQWLSLSQLAARIVYNKP